MSDVSSKEFDKLVKTVERLCTRITKIEEDNKKLKKNVKTMAGDIHELKISRDTLRNQIDQVGRCS